jgi:hypothetical protein
MRVTELSRKLKHTKSKPEVDAMIAKMRKEDEKLVKGQFEFVEAEGGFFEFTYRKYPGDAIQTYQLIHGERCEVPMGIVKHLNGTKKKIRRYQNVEQPPSGGVMTPRTFETTSRVRFVPIEFL